MGLAQVACGWVVLRFGTVLAKSAALPSMLDMPGWDLAPWNTGGHCPRRSAWIGTGQHRAVGRCHMGLRCPRDPQLRAVFPGSRGGAPRMSTRAGV